MRFLSLLSILTLHIATTAAQLQVNGDRPIARVPRNTDWSIEPDYYPSTAHRANFMSQTSLSKMAGIVSSDMVISSLSISLSLFMVSLGSENTTGQEFDAALGISYHSLLPSKMRAILNDLTNYKEFPLHVANVLYVSPHFQIQPEFSEALVELQLTAETVNFKNANDTNEIISEWCRTHTNERITNVLSPGDSDKAMQMINAVYFKGKWLQKFVISATELRTFHLDSKTVKQVPTMAVTGMFLHGEWPEMEATFVRLPFKSDAIDSAMNMFIILPKTTEAYSPFGMEFIWLDSSKLTSTGTVQKIYVQLPKFKIANKIDFKEVVTRPNSDYNLSSMVDPREADFRGFATFPRLFLKEIVQDSAIEINEEGCEAVSAMGDSIDASRDGVNAFIADRPFYALITTTGEPPLFVFGVWINGRGERTFT